MAGDGARSAPRGYETRLGSEATRKAGDYFPDGVAFVALAPLGDAALGHARDFWTWRSPAHEQGLTDEEEPTELMAGMVRSFVRDTTRG
jgi:hypothetical protein